MNPADALKPQQKAARRLAEARRQMDATYGSRHENPREFTKAQREILDALALVEEWEV